jgi:2-dehydro-3-deoxygluconokinase
MVTAPSSEPAGLVTIGETMVLLDPPQVGLLRQATTLRVSMGGAESNVAIGVCRLGLPASWLGRVGADPFGDLVVTRLRGEGVDVSGVVRDPSVPTSLMVKERRAPVQSASSTTARTGPGARLQPSDLDPRRIGGAQVLHLTGITRR